MDEKLHEMKWIIVKKKAEMISSTRKLNTSNPCIIYDSYNLLGIFFKITLI